MSTHATSRHTGPPTPVARWVVAPAIAGTVLIALGAFWLSFTALTDLATGAGISAGQAWVWPLIVDGIIVVATISVVALSPFGRSATRYPWALLICGAAVSVSGNAAHAVVAADSLLPRGWAAAISSVPPLVLLAITHLTVELTRRTHAAVDPEKEREDQVVFATPAGNGTSGRRRRELAWERHRAGWSNTRIARDLDVHPSTVGRWLADPPPRHADRRPAAGHGADRRRRTTADGRAARRDARSNRWKLTQPVLTCPARRRRGPTPVLLARQTSTHRARRRSNISSGTTRLGPPRPRWSRRSPTGWHGGAAMT